MIWRKSSTSTFRRVGVLASAILPVLLLFTPVAEAQPGDAASEEKQLPEVVAFDFQVAELKLQVEAVNTQVLGEFAVAGGKITFIDEGTTVSTVLVGGDEVFALANKATSLASLYAELAPRGERVPQALVRADAERQRAGQTLVFGGTTAGPTISEDFEVGEDDWAEGCTSDSDYDWNTGFEDWADDGNFIAGSNDFSETLIVQTDNATLGDINGYFGTLDSIWFATCLAEGVLSSVQMEFRDYSICYASGTSSTGFECGAWSPINGTSALLDPGERYLYHNHSLYSPLRRGNVTSLGTAQFTGWTYFVSGAATDNFAADDWYQAP